LIIVALFLFVGGYILLVRPSRYMSKEKAFEIIQHNLNASSIFDNGSRTFDLSFLRDLHNWDDTAGDMFQTNRPQLIRGTDVVASFSVVGFEEVYSSQKDISADEKYWSFSWIRTSVLDESYSFYVDATSGVLSLVGHYQMKYISKENAFEHLQSFIREKSTGKDLGYYNWITKLKSYDDQDAKIQMFNLVYADMSDGRHILFNSETPSVGNRIVYGSTSNIVSANKYWIFSWHSPGVIDKTISFYLDALDGRVVEVTEYSSPE